MNDRRTQENPEWILLRVASDLKGSELSLRHNNDSSHPTLREWSGISQKFETNQIYQVAERMAVRTSAL